MELHFSDCFGVDPQALVEYGAFDISLASDLPLFIDPFLLFNSDKPEYQSLHESILAYLVYLKDKAVADLDDATIANLYRFKEVRQNWLGFTVLGNGGSGLGHSFAVSLHRALGSILNNFGDESVTRSSHLEKLCLIRPGVGRDSISDFTTNLIKDFLCDYTAMFARDHLSDEVCRDVPVTRARFNYATETWQTVRYRLPYVNGDFVLLTPVDLLTRDDTWINYSDMVNRFPLLPEAIPDPQLRAEVNAYFRSHLTRHPKKQDIDRAAALTIRNFPELIDRYIKLKEDQGDQAAAISAKHVEAADGVFVQQLKDLLADLESRTTFFDLPSSSYEESLARAHFFKDYIENQDGYLLVNRAGRPISSEKDVQLFFGLVWYGSQLDLNREVNNGRGPVDFKASRGAIDKSLIEFKLASNSQLRRNLERQVAIYEAANGTRKSVKVIVAYTAGELAKVSRTLKALKLTDEPSIVVIDARNDNKPSGSKA
ncbi:MAG: hypothetical protein R2743_02530 [Ilumatobacteraceae bacterium]